MFFLLSPCGQARQPAMTQRPRTFLPSRLVTLAIFLIYFLPAKGDTGPKRVFVVHSYSENWQWTASQMRGYLKGLETGGYPKSEVSIRSFWMDTKQVYKSDEEAARRGERAIESIQAFKPHLVLSSDDRALEMVGVKYTERHMEGNESYPYIPFVFSGVDREPATAYPEVISPGRYITGALERTDYDELLRFVINLYPEATDIRFLMDDTPTSQAKIISVQSHQWADDVLAALSGGITSKKLRYFQELETDLEELPRNTTAVVWQSAQRFLNESNNATVPPPDVYQRILQFEDLMSVGGSTDYGLLGTFSVSPELMANYAALMGARVLDGEAVENLPITNPGIMRLGVNPRRARLIDHSFLTLQVPLAGVAEEEVALDTLTGEPYRLYFVHSYSEDSVWPTEQEEAIIEGFQKQGIPRGSFRIQRLFLDILHATETELNKSLENVVEDIREWKPELVYLTDDQALSSVGVPLLRRIRNDSSHPLGPFAQLQFTHGGQGEYGKAPVVIMTGINSDPRANYPLLTNTSSSLPHLYGFLQHPDFGRLFDVAIGLFSSVRTIYMISDCSFTGLQDVKLFREYSEVNGLPSNGNNQDIRVVNKAFTHFEDFQFFVNSKQEEEGVMLYMSSYFSFLRRGSASSPDAADSCLMEASRTSGEGEKRKEIEGAKFTTRVSERQGDSSDVMRTSEVVLWLRKASKLPEISANPLFAWEGGLAGVGPDPRLFGQAAGSFGALLVEGKSLRIDPITDSATELVSFYYNERRKEELELEPSLETLVQARSVETLIEVEPEEQEEDDDSNRDAEAAITGGTVAAIVLPTLAAACVVCACGMVVVCVVVGSVIVCCSALYAHHKREKLLSATLARLASSRVPTKLKSYRSDCALDEQTHQQEDEGESDETTVICGSEESTKPTHFF